MTQELEVSTSSETQNQELATDAPEVVTPEVDAVETAAEPEQEKPEDGLKKSLERMQRRIDKKTAETTRLWEANARLQAQLASKAPAPGDATAEEVDVDALVDHKTRVREFTNLAAKIVGDGSKTHADFKEVVRDDLVDEVGPLVQENGLPSQFMAVVLEVSDDPKAMLYHLGKNLDLASELAGLSQTKLAARLDRIQIDLARQSKPKPGTAPTPLTPVKPSATSSAMPNDNDSVDDWMRKERARMKSKGLLNYG